jgi:hypothetical protein
MIITDKNKILGFLRGKTKDYRGRTFKEIIYSSDEVLERCHDQVQQIFPLHEESCHASTYPIITPEIAEEAKKDSKILDNLRLAKNRFEKFFAIGEYENIDSQREWCKNGNHNLLRITRIIRCLRLFGLETEAKEFYKNIISNTMFFELEKTTYDYWHKAYCDDVWKTLQG